MRYCLLIPMVIGLLLINSPTSNAQSDTFTSNYIAVFGAAKDVVSRDAEGRLNMIYSISGLFSEEEVAELKRLFSAYDIFETFSITPTDIPGTFVVVEKTKVGVSVSAHRKLFVISGIDYVEIDGKRMKSENFTIEGFEQQ